MSGLEASKNAIFSKKQSFKLVRVPTYTRSNFIRNSSFAPSTVRKNADGFNDIDWRRCKLNLSKKQAEIVWAYREKDSKKVLILQKELARSFAARALAVKKVTSNTGKNTPGFDGEIWNTSKDKMKAILNLKDLSNYKASPVRRTYIPKADGSKRPLGIPTMFDRAVQTIWMFAIDPIAEESSDVRSYGFRTFRGVHDCATYIHLVSASYTNVRRFVLDADIKEFFPSVSHKWLLENIPMDKSILREFLKAGFLELGKFNPTDLGFPQGGAISPVIANMTLNGLEKALGSEFLCTRYADDFIVFGKSKRELRKLGIPRIKEFLDPRGLELNLNKTTIKSMTEGYDFLGLNFREFKDPNRKKGTKEGVFLVHPSSKKINEFRRKLSKTVRLHRSSEISVLINALNQMLRGWAEHYRAVSSTRVFNTISRHLFIILWKFLRNRYRKVPKRRIVKKHFTKVGNNRWVFFDEISSVDSEKNRILLFQIGDVRLKRHMICSNKNPYDPENYAYFDRRIARMSLPDANPKSKHNKLYKKQKGICPVCGDTLRNHTDLEIHHIKAKSEGGSNRLTNLLLLHKDCHQQVTNTKNPKILASFKEAGIIP